MQFIKILSMELLYFTNLKNKMYQFLLFFQPLVFLTIIYFIGLTRLDININKYIFATAIISMWSYVLYSSGSSLISQKWNNTLALIIASPTSLYKIIISKVISNSIVSLISFFLTLFYAKVIFKFELIIGNSTIFIISLFFLLFSLSVIGIILATIFIAFKNVYDMQDLILYPVLIISGIFYPVYKFPLIIMIFSYCLPMTWSIQSIYTSIDKSSFNIFSLLISFCISIIYLIISYFIVKRIEKILKIKGSIGVI